MTYEIGQSVPFEKPRGIVAGPDMSPVWFALQVPSQKQRATTEHLRAHGVYAFYPSEQITRRVKGKKITRERAIVSGQVYAQFRQAPQWDVLIERQRLITGVFCRNGWPVEIPRDVIRHLQGLTVEAEALKAARAELLRVREGDRAKIVSGPLEGFQVDVEGVRDGMVWFSFITGGRGRANLKDLERNVDVRVKE